VEILLLADTAYLQPPISWVGHLAEQTWAVGGIGLLAGFATVRWGRWCSRISGAAALLGLACLCVVHAYVRGEHDESLFYAGILLGGWLVTEASADALSSDDDAAAWGVRGAIAFLAGSYLAAAVAKLGSASWWDGENIRMALSMAADIYPNSPWLPMRQWMASTSWVPPAAAVATVAIELGAVLLVGGGRMRAFAGGALWCLHLGIWGSLGVLFPEPLLVLPLMAWPWYTRLDAVDRLVRPGSPQPRWTGAITAWGALLASAWLWLGAGPQAPVFEALRTADSAVALGDGRTSPEGPAAPRGPSPPEAGTSAAPQPPPWNQWLVAAGTSQARDSKTSGLAALYKAATTGAKVDEVKIWGCDAGHISEGRPGVERVGCMVSLPGQYLRRALFPSPERPQNHDVHAFLMGAQASAPDAPGYDPDAKPDESPPHEVILSPFWLQRTTVSLRQYRLCVELGPCSEAEIGQGGDFNYAPTRGMASLVLLNSNNEEPITGVTWQGAKSYCEWIGGRLPTEAEWEYAARGGALQLRYPWGEAEPTCRHAVFGGGPEGRCGVKGPGATSSRLASGHRTHSYILQQAGNVWEWTADWYAPDYY
ncbi:MAG: SUMF1/EgtB/PvdO family nonheme iron enzyme, partial [Myxococcota bacterium]|nr:SUMF1/EgtB/PvdO family nonheme iron enzyme [Myxococcota bacterium]